MHTISTSFRNYWKQEQKHANIELSNGMKVNVDFFWFAVELGVLSPDD